MRKNSSKSRTTYALAGLCALTLVGCSKPGGGGGGSSEESVFTINGEAVPMKEYYATLERKPSVQIMTEQGPQEGQVAGMLGLQAMRDLVNKKLILQLAKEDGLLPTDADVKAELDIQEQRNPKLITTLTEQGLTLEEIKANVLFSLARENLITKGVTVPMTEVEQYIKEHPQAFMEPARAKLLYVIVNDATKKPLVDKDLQSGQDFQTVTMRYSDSPQVRQDNGVFPEEVLSRMPPFMQDAINKTAEMKVTPWLQAGSAWVRFYVQKKTPAKKMDMTDARKKELKRQMALERGSRANDLYKRVNDKLRAAKIDVGPKNLRLPWEKAFEEEKKAYAQQEAASQANAPAPGAGTTPAAPPTGTAPTGTAPSGAPGK